MNRLQKSIDKENIKPFYDEWVILENILLEIFNNRKKGSEEFMIQGITLYKSLLNHCSADGEPFEPLNNAQRLQFIEANPSAYAAFRQLQELFKEMEKKLASKRAMLGKL